MSPSVPEKCRMPAASGNHDKRTHLHRNGQKVRFENEEAEIIRISPLMVIKTRDRLVCGALYDRIQYLVA